MAGKPDKMCIVSAREAVREATTNASDSERFHLKALQRSFGATLPEPTATNNVGNSWGTRLTVTSVLSIKLLKIRLV